MLTHLSLSLSLSLCFIAWDLLSSLSLSLSLSPPLSFLVWGLLSCVCRLHHPSSLILICYVFFFLLRLLSQLLPNSFNFLLPSLFFLKYACCLLFTIFLFSISNTPCQNLVTSIELFIYLFFKKKKKEGGLLTSKPAVGQMVLGKS